MYRPYFILSTKFYIFFVVIVDTKKVSSAARPPLRNVTNVMSHSQGASKALDTLFSAVDDGGVAKKIKPVISLSMM